MFEARIVAVGRITNAVGPNNALPHGQGEVVFDDLVVPHALMKGRKSITLEGDFTGARKGKHLVLIDIQKGKLKIYSGIPLDDKGEIERYIRGGLELKDRSSVARMRYSVPFLHSSDDEVSVSAASEFLRADYADLRKVAETLKPGPLVKTLQDDSVLGVRLGIHATLLGHCGNKEHAVFLRKLIDARLRDADGFAIDGLLFGYALLEPQRGWDLLTDILKEKDSTFLRRYYAFRTIRKLGNERPDIADRKKGAAGLELVLDLPDMADFAMETLALWQRWEYCERILSLEGTKGYDTGINRRHMLRFALRCPTQTAKDFVNNQRARDPEFVADTEEVLALETPSKK